MMQKRVTFEYVSIVRRSADCASVVIESARGVRRASSKGREGAGAGRGGGAGAQGRWPFDVPASSRITSLYGGIAPLAELLTATCAVRAVAVWGLPGRRGFIRREARLACAKLLILSRTTLMPRSSDAFSSMTRFRYWSPKSWRAQARIVLVLPVPGGP